MGYSCNCNRKNSNNKLILKQAFDDGVNIISVTNFTTTVTYNTANCWYIKFKKYIFINIVFNGEPLNIRSLQIATNIPRAYSGYNFTLPGYISTISNASTNVSFTNITCRIWNNEIHINDSLGNLPNNIENLILSGVYISVQ